MNESNKMKVISNKLDISLRSREAKGDDPLSSGFARNATSGSFNQGSKDGEEMIFGTDGIFRLVCNTKDGDISNGSMMVSALSVPDDTSERRLSEWTRERRQRDMLVAELHRKFTPTVYFRPGGAVASGIGGDGMEDGDFPSDYAYTVYDRSKNQAEAEDGPPEVPLGDRRRVITQKGSLGSAVVKQFRAKLGEVVPKVGDSGDALVELSDYSYHPHEYARYEGGGEGDAKRKAQKEGGSPPRRAPRGATGTLISEVPTHTNDEVLLEGGTSQERLPGEADNQVDVDMEDGLLELEVNPEATGVSGTTERIDIGIGEGGRTMEGRRSVGADLADTRTDRGRSDARQTTDGSRGDGLDSRSLAVATEVYWRDLSEPDLPRAMNWDPDAKLRLRWRQRFCLFAAVILLLILLLVTILPVLTKKKRDEPSPPTTNATISLKEALVEFGVEREKINEVGMPHHMAFEWMNSTVLRSGSNLGLISQRYLMALLYFATSSDGWTFCGPPSSEKKEDDDCEGIDVNYAKVKSKRWLSGESECDWFGVVCSDDYVTEIEIGA